jgi:uncharacterized membrane protein
MTPDPDRPSESSSLEDRLGSLLGKGTWLGCAAIAVGLAVQLFDERAALGNGLISAGIGIIIALPILRVAAMLEYFARRKEARFAVVCAVVLVVVAVGVLLGYLIR